MVDVDCHCIMGRIDGGSFAAYICRINTVVNVLATKTSGHPRTVNYCDVAKYRFAVFFSSPSYLTHRNLTHLPVFLSFIYVCLC